ncbi:MAG: sugar ABC transporter ATP-binding protein [Treponema sp.]|jgi:ABC-type sugar transport system ATPase subunit|nr:sugar ABC transporter ATP-binding protein [Treponema sp.]
METGGQYILEARDITKYYGSAAVLQKVNFPLKEGEVHALLGANGAGKSTLLKILDGVIGSYEGSLLLKGKPVQLEGPGDARMKGIGMVHQELTVLPNITVGENIFLGRLPKTALGTVDWKRLYEQSKELLNSIGLNVDPNLNLGRLTVADMQMVEIARIVSLNAPIILLDEPTSALSEMEIRRLLRLIERFRTEGKSIVFITHKLNEILAVSDRITVLRDGQVVDTVQVTDRSKEAERSLVGKMIGGGRDNISNMFPPKGGGGGDVVLELKGLSRNILFSGISLSVARGEVVVLTGLKGSRRTEVLRCIFGADPFTGGEIVYKGETLTATSIKKSIDGRIAMVTEDRKGEGLVTLMNVKHNISLSTIRDCAKFGLVNKKKIDAKAGKFVDTLAIKAPSVNVPVSSLSGGNQQKVVLAKWLASRPDLFLLDEPTRGIDIGAKMEIYKLIRQMADNGAAVLMVSSEIPEAIGMGDRIYVMREGKMEGELSRGGMNGEKLMHMMFGHK